MERLIAAFTGVLRGLADVQQLSTLASTLASGEQEDTSISASDRLGLLDFPEPEQQQANIATATSLPKADLLRCAAESPGDLTIPEINLLKQRYWLDLTEAEKNEQSRAQSALLAVSQEHWKEATEELQRVRSPLYDTNEEKSLLNAGMEEWRRGMEAMQQRRRQQVESVLGRAQPWVKKLWEEDHAEKEWGFAAFFDPDVKEDEAEKFEARKSAVLMWARDAVGCGDVIGAEWRMQYLDWPDDVGEGEGESEDAGESEDDGDDEVESAEGAAEEPAAKTQTTGEPESFDADVSLLRERFRTIRDGAPKKRRKQDPHASTSGLKDGILSNVFLLVTQSCVDSVLSDRSGSVDDMWVWAIDPNYEGPASGQTAATEYKGYFRVRLQQLVNNFFDARRFHENQYSMRQLWEAAQKSKNQAFVSMKDHEIGLWVRSRDVGSALRPAGSQRIITNLDDL